MAGLLATAWLVLPHGGRDLFRRILMGWTVASLALTWALIMVLILRLVVRNVSRVDVVPATLRAAGAGVWFAPAVLLPPTPAGLTAAVVLVIGATRLLCADCPGEAALPVRDGLALPDDWERGAGPAQGVSIATAAGLQGAVAMLLLGHSDAAGVLLCLAVAEIGRAHV